MRYNTIIILLLTIAMYSCSDKQTEAKLDPTLADSNISINEDHKALKDVECAFDTSTYKFTTEAILKYSPNLKYLWDTTSKSARVQLNNGDSLILHIGGCNHFAFQATLLTSVNFADTTELFKKTAWLAKNFFYNGFEHKVPNLISQRHIVLSDNDINKNKQTYKFEDPEKTETNLILDGFSFKKHRNQTVIDILVYID